MYVEQRAGRESWAGACMIVGGLDHVPNSPQVPMKLQDIPLAYCSE